MLSKGRDVSLPLKTSGRTHVSCGPAGFLARGFVTLLMAGAVVTVIAGASVAADTKAEDIARQRPDVLSLQDALLHDAAAPSLGDPDADVTVVAFIDYNCGFCKKSEAGLEALLREDPRVRVIYKNLPFLAKSSAAEAKIAVASAWQGKFAEVHHALMGLQGGAAEDDDISRAVVSAGVDLPRLNRDLDRRDAEIVALLKRNIAEADALGIKGTPVYLVGPFMTASPLDLDQFRKLVAAARAEPASPVSGDPLR